MNLSVVCFQGDTNTAYLYTDLITGERHTRETRGRKRRDRAIEGEEERERET